MAAAGNEGRVHLASHRKDHDPEEHAAKIRVFESDADMDSETVYLAYEKRWLIETLFLFCKDVNEFDETCVHSDHSVIMTEFVNFLSTVLTSRLLKRFRRVEASDDVTYGRTMRLLERAKKVCIDGR